LDDVYAWVMKYAQLIKLGDFRALEHHYSEGFAYAFGKTYAEELLEEEFSQGRTTIKIAFQTAGRQGGAVVVGHDMRSGSSALAKALAAGVCASGQPLIYLGCCPTELLYYAVMSKGALGGVMITASHNPQGYMGFKMVTRGAQPWLSEAMLHRIQRKIDEVQIPETFDGPKVDEEILSQAIHYFVNRAKVLEMPHAYKLFCYGLNGCASLLNAPIMKALGMDVTWLGSEPSSRFDPDGPNPDLPQVERLMTQNMKGKAYDLGLAWDGDGDRCVFFDAQGGRIAPCYINGFLAEILCTSTSKGKSNGSSQTVVHSVKQMWNLADVVDAFGGQLEAALTGHVHIKSKMKACDAIYGCEPSSHHYFREFGYCDSGVLPWILLLPWLKSKELSLRDAAEQRKARVEVLPELSIRSNILDAMKDRLEKVYGERGAKFDEFDGLNMSFDTEAWRMNLRSSNTEPVLRLNIEGRMSASELAAKRDEVLELIRSV
jgi:phosphomannomutase